jgi:hypothetical protein
MTKAPKQVRRLTAKQEKFVLALVSGASQREAYAAAYRCQRMKPESIDSCACRLLANVKVASRYDELMAELASRTLWDRERATRELLEVREIALEHVRATKGHAANFTDKGSRELADLPKAAIQIVIASTAELNKMFGIYEKAGEDAGCVPVIIDDIPRGSR